MLAQRLDKLESDLQFLIAIHDALLQDDNDSNRRSDDVTSSSAAIEIPERDVSNHRNKRSTGNPAGKTLRGRPNNKSSNAETTSASSNTKTVEVTQCSEGDGGATVTPPGFELYSLRQELAKEKAFRLEVEESAKHVYVKLQKIEDELAREKEQKQSLLTGTLQLKNLVHGYDSKINELSVELQESKGEAERLSAENLVFSQNSQKFLESLRNLCLELSQAVSTNSQSFSKPSCETFNRIEPCLELLRQLATSIIKKVKGDDSESSEKIRTLTNQVNSIMGQVEKLEKEREETSLELKHCLDRETHLKQQLHTCQSALTTAESELLKKQIEHDYTLQRLETDGQIEKDKASLKLSEYHSVIQRTKELLFTMKGERDKHRKVLEDTRSKLEVTEHRLQVAEGEKASLEVKLEKTKGKLHQVSCNTTEVAEKERNDRIKLEVNLRTAVMERKQCLELLSEMKGQVVAFKRRNQHDKAMFEVEREKFASESKRLTDNLKVLQKVSEDQGQTVTKLRAEVDTLKDANFKLDSQLRDWECTQNHLVRKLEESEGKCQRYAKEVDKLEEQLLRYSEELKSHDCDDFVDSKYKKKLKEMEDLLMTKRRSWEEALAEVESEKELAVEAARKTMKKLEEMQEEHESQIKGLQGKREAEVAEMHTKHGVLLSEKCSRIEQLQSELDRVKLTSSQIHRALTIRVQQLQAALTICLGSNQTPMPPPAPAPAATTTSLQFQNVCPIPFVGNSGNLFSNVIHQGDRQMQMTPPMMNSTSLPNGYQSGTQVAAAGITSDPQGVGGSFVDFIGNLMT